LTLANCTLSNNSATGIAGGGGAIFHGEGTLTMTNCTLSGKLGHSGLRWRDLQR